MKGFLIDAGKRSRSCSIINTYTELDRELTVNELGVWSAPRTGTRSDFSPSPPSKASEKRIPRGPIDGANDFEPSANANVQYITIKIYVFLLRIKDWITIFFLQMRALKDIHDLVHSSVGAGLRIETKRVSTPHPLEVERRSDLEEESDYFEPSVLILPEQTEDEMDVLTRLVSPPLYPATQRYDALPIITVC